MKLFVSYARVDKPLCKQIVERLSDVHDVWYDRRLHAGMDWWKEIQERLDWCEGFVYLLSPESVTSEYCQKEYSIAVASGRHIFPVLIQARTEIPDELQRVHYADLSQGMEDMYTLMNALLIAERRQRKPAPKPKAAPSQPDTPPRDTRPALALGKAADAIENDNFDSAVFIIKQALEKKPAGRVGRMLRTLLQDAEQSLEQQAYLREAEREYAPVRELVQREATRSLGCEEFADFKDDFPDYDPDNLAELCGSTAVSIKSNVLDILPPPFVWIDIPAGQVTLEKGGYLDSETTFDVEPFRIAKYPITNAQYAKFIEAGGYSKQQYWTDAGWQWRQKKGVTEPGYWQDSKFNGSEQPVNGVSWYEAYAFSQWLSEVTGEPITLPTEQQWQRAAQGDDNRVYPWGDKWGSNRANADKNHKTTTPVTKYESKGDSPFGVVDMSGNLWEWCLTQWYAGRNDSSGSSPRVLRGGSFRYNLLYARCASRLHLYPPRPQYLNLGLRLVCGVPVQR